MFCEGRKKAAMIVVLELFKQQNIVVGEYFIIASRKLTIDSRDYSLCETYNNMISREIKKYKTTNSHLRFIQR